MKRAKPTYVDSAVRSDRPPKVPAHGHPLHRGDARRLARWLLRYASRKPSVPLSPSAVRKLRQIIHGVEIVPPDRKPFEPTVTRFYPPFREREFLAISEYVRKRKAQLKQGQAATLRLQLGFGGVRLTR